jgi:PP-loop superfamily ATP-utilizing enzyme
MIEQMAAQKVLLLYSGGLDSRLSLKLLKEQGYQVRAAFFQIPFNTEHSGNDPFLESEEVTLDIFDCTRGRLLKDYLELLKKPEYGRGSGYNPCLDCKLFMLKHASEYAKKHNYQALATGEVPGQRPMSQTKNKMKIVRETINMPIIRPLANKGIEGRSRKSQMELAQQYNIDYPSPAGGCLLCEKELKTRFKTLIEKNIIKEVTSPLISVGRHYYFPELQTWIVVGRNKPENDVIEQFSNVIKSGKGKPAVYYESIASDNPIQMKETAIKLQKAFQDKDREKIDYYANWKL